MAQPFKGMTHEQIHAALAKQRAEKAKGDQVMNQKILQKVRPGVLSKESFARAYLKSSKALVGISGDERTAIQRALLEFQGNKDSFLDYMEGKFDRTRDDWEFLYDNEMHLADEASEMVTAARKGAETKSWVLGDSKSGPCDECVALAAENQDVPISEAYSNGEKLAYVHPGCCCSSQYSDGSNSESQ